ncbi:MAG: response regulator [Sphingobacteriales bacterium]|nr:MAG: response regulator [Sphingobacteriales bacterium]
MGRPTVIFVDDDPDDGGLLHDAFQQCGCTAELIELRSGAEFLSLMDLRRGNPPPDLVLLDLNMPVLDGWETLRRFRSVFPAYTVPVIMYTTSASPLDREKGVEQGVEVVTKPSSIREIYHFAERLVSKYNLQC